MRPVIESAPVQRTIRDGDLVFRFSTLGNCVNGDRLDDARILLLVNLDDGLHDDFTDGPILVRDNRLEFLHRHGVN
jgi:hypothetical protein